MGLFVAGYDTRLYIGGSTTKPNYYETYFMEVEYDDYSTDDSGIVRTIWFLQKCLHSLCNNPQLLYNYFTAVMFSIVQLPKHRN